MKGHEKVKRNKIYIIEEKRNWRKVFHTLTLFLFIVGYFIGLFLLTMCNIYALLYVALFYYAGFLGSVNYIINWFCEQDYSPKEIRKEIEVEEVR